MFPPTELTTKPPHGIRVLFINGTVMLGEAKHLGPFTCAWLCRFDLRFLASLRMTFPRWRSWQREPAFVTRPRDRFSFSKTMWNSGQGFRPPEWLANDPPPATPACITKLRENAPASDCDRV